MAKFVLTCLGVLAFVSATAAQSDEAFFARLKPGMAVDGRPGCVWAWSASTAGPWGGWFQSCATPDPTPPAPTAPVCNPWPNPYQEFARLLACLASRPAPVPHPEATVFIPGERYQDGGYPWLVAICLTTGIGVDGRPFAVLQRLTDTANGPAGQLLVIRTDEHFWYHYRGGQQ